MGQSSGSNKLSLVASEEERGDHLLVHEAQKLVNTRGSKIDCFANALADFLDMTDVEIAEKHNVGGKGYMLDLSSYDKILNRLEVLKKKTWCEDAARLKTFLQRAPKGDYLIAWTGKTGHVVRARVSDEGVTLWDPSNVKAYPLPEKGRSFIVYAMNARG